MANYLMTVKDVREALKGLRGDMPVSFYVDSDAEERQMKGMPVLVGVTTCTPTPEERKDREEAAADGVKDEWSHREIPMPKSYILFLVG